MASIKWIKLFTDVFDNRKIKQIESLPDGDSIIVIWFKLLSLAGNINDSGFIYFTKEIPYTEQMLSTQFNRPLSTIQLAMRTFEQFEMIEIIDNIYHISNWEKYQNIEGMEKVREQTRQRVAKHREKQKALPSNVTVTLRNATEEEGEEEGDKDIYIKSSKEDLTCLAASLKVDYQEVVNLFNQICISYPKVTTLSDKRRKAISARLKAYRLEGIRKCFEKAEASDFLKGANSRNWSANFDWLMQDSNMAKVLDGNYDNRKEAGGGKHREGNTEDYSSWESDTTKLIEEIRQGRMS